MRSKIILLPVVYCLLFTLIGCESFVRKFTRKSKKDKLPQEELVLAPSEYTDNINKADLYQQYFVYWKSWQEELSDSLLRNSNHKKHLQCANEALKNLEELRKLLNELKGRKLAPDINDLIKLRDAIESDIYNANWETNRSASERIKRNIIKDFSYSKVKDSIL